MRERVLRWYLAGAVAADRILTPYRRRDRTVRPDLTGDDTFRLADRELALGWLERERAAWWPPCGMRSRTRLCWHGGSRTRCGRSSTTGATTRTGCRWTRRPWTARAGWATPIWKPGCCVGGPSRTLTSGGWTAPRQLFERGQRLCAERGDSYGVAAAAEGLGMVALRQRRYPDAVAHFDRQLRLSEAAGERRRCALALLNLGVVGNDSGEFAAAATWLRRAAAAFARPDTADPYNANRVRVELGRALGHLGEHAAARRELAAALAGMRALGSPRGEAQALHRLGELAVAVRDPAARGHLTGALARYRELADVEAAEVVDLIRASAVGAPPADADSDGVA